MVAIKETKLMLCKYCGEEKDVDVRRIMSFICFWCKTQLKKNRDRKHKLSIKKKGGIIK